LRILFHVILLDCSRSLKERAFAFNYSME